MCQRRGAQRAGEYGEERDGGGGALNSTVSGLYILQSTCTSSCWVVFEADRTIKSFSDGKSEAGRMISLGAELSLEVSSVTSEHSLEGMVVMGCVEERGALVFGF